MRGSLREAFEETDIVPAPFIGKPNAKLNFDTRLPPIEHRQEVGFLLDYYFDVIMRPDDEAMLEYCFVEDSDYHQYERTLQSLLRERRLILEEEVQVYDLQIDSLLAYLESPTVANRAKIVLAVGRVGAGKSTFLNRFFRVFERDTGLPNFIIDLLPEPMAATVPSEKEVERISRKILESVSDRYHNKEKFGPEFDPFSHSTLRTIFASAVKRLERGPKAELYQKDRILFDHDVANKLEELSADTTRLLPLYVRYVTKRKRHPFCLIFDNVDRASDEYQRFVYTFAQNLARQIEGVVIVSLRDSTYRKAKKMGFLDTTVSDVVFHVKPPNITMVISKRLKYYRRHLDQPETAPNRIKGHLEKLEPHAQHLKRLFLQDDQSAARLLTCLANRNARAAFDLLRRYCLSPYSGMQWDGTDAGHHLLRALMLGDSCAYFQERSPIVNLFRVPTNIRISHLLKFSLLWFLAWEKENSGHDFTLVDDVMREFEAWGFPRVAVKGDLDELVANSLIEVLEIAIPDTAAAFDDFQLEHGDKIRLSPAGFEYLNHISCDPLYQCYCAGDTVWYSEERLNAFVQEFRTAVELSSSGDEVARDLVLDSNCAAIWLDYLQDELRLDAKHLTTAGAPWRRHVVNKWQSLVPVPTPSAQANPAERCESSGESIGPRIEQLELFENKDTEAHTPDEPAIKIGALLQDFPALSETTVWAETVYVPRVLWGLILAEKVGRLPLGAAQLAKFISDHSGVHVQETNLARFFRDCRKSGSHGNLWEEELYSARRVYRPSNQGRLLFQSIFGEI